MSTKETANIVHTPEILGGKPRLEGTRIGVHMIGESIREGTHTIGTILAGYPDLSRAQVAAALEYYDEHPDEMADLHDRKEATKQRLIEGSRAPATDTDTDPAERL
jgi:uncharacterized protein (DUF433 family)